MDDFAKQFADELYNVFMRRMTFEAVELSDADTRWKTLRKDEILLLQKIYRALPADQHVPIIDDFSSTQST